MASPFPGMDPYLEQPAFWSSFHSKFVVAMADAIEARLDAAYYVEVETRTYLDDDGAGLLVGIPDVSVGVSSSGVAPASVVTAVMPQTQTGGLQKVLVPTPEEVREHYLEVRELASGRVVTVIELLSPKNKKSGEGRQSYENKRSLILGSRTHLIEIDLLRAGQSMPMRNVQVAADYHILISRSQHCPQADLYGFSIRDRIPTISIPLVSQAELEVDLQAVFNGLYARSRYRTRIDYQQPVPSPKLASTCRS
jgi:hypothetical protein